MKKRFTIFLTILLVSHAAFPHRLNEYLEAATIKLFAGKVMIEFHLTPGVDIANEILKEIDRNNDHSISPREQRQYVEQFRHDLAFTIDGHPKSLTPVSFSFSGMEDFRKGAGDILIDLVTTFERTDSLHHLKLINSHHRSVAVYLVNCLFPGDSIHIDTQFRSVDQSVYELAFRADYLEHNSSAQRQLLKKDDRKSVIKNYFVHGIRHILTGYDHLLFLCALVLGATGLWDLVKIITAFTIAHSITLTLATFGLAHLPEQVVEPIIAGSIIFIAVQNIWWPKESHGNSRFLIAFFFGLFHGFSFAGGLMELMHAMPEEMIIFAIIGFSLGVEAGNQLILFPLYSLLRLLRRSSENSKTNNFFSFQKYASAAVAIAGMYYFCFDLFTYFKQ